MKVQNQAWCLWPLAY